MVCPTDLPIINGKLVSSPPESGTLHPERKRKKRKTNAANAVASVCGEAMEGTNAHAPVKGKAGRPKGSTNRKTVEREVLEAAQSQAPKRKREVKISGWSILTAWHVERDHLLVLT